jgi:glucokinase
MSRTIGIVVSSRIVAGLMEDHKLVGELSQFPDNPDDHEALLEHPFESLCHLITDQVMALQPEGQIDAIGVALPGIIRGGIVEDSPNLAQLKGGKIAEALSGIFQSKGIVAPLKTMNDADAVAAGLAVTQGRMDRLVRVWTIGNGIGFGRYPYTAGVWEGGHMVVTLDPKETYCGCGGRGHLEGIMGYRAMRLRFLDMEPEDFVRLWHRGLGAATATSIHLGGPGRFYFTGINVRFLDLNLLKEYLWQMVKMSPLQSYALEVVPENSEVAVIGAAASALLAPDS